MNSKFRVNDATYFVEQFGQGAPLVLLHGFSGSSLNWQRFLHIWGKQHHIIAVDILGHGRSSCPLDPQRYNMGCIVDDLMAIFEQLGVQTVDLLGYSMGGRLALATAVSHPAKIRSLILESASPGLETDTERGARCLRDNQLADFIDQEGIIAFVNRWEQLPIFASQQRLPLSTQNGLRQQRLQNQPLGLGNSLRGMGTGQQPSYWSSLPKLKTPTLLLAGALDQKFVAINKRMQHLMAHATLEIVPDAGHTIHLERPLHFAQLISTWLRN